VNISPTRNGPPAAAGSSPGGAAVFVEGLVKEYGPASARIPVLRGLDLTVARGERIALLGKSGSGKSTLLHLLGGLDEPTAGTIRVDGADLAAMAANERAAYRLAAVGMIFQAFYLVPTRSAAENVELPMVLAGRPRSERRAAAQTALEAVGMGHRLTHHPAQLSGGERQRVAIARALVNRPRLLLADEPTGNLDTTTGAEVIALILDYVKSAGATLVLVTHDEELAERCADRVLHMKDGVIVG
jgi:predicted ABC-type transport system involved in lysophospholipase L1 biosynthesis ATPase subunit